MRRYNALLLSLSIGCGEGAIVGAEEEISETTDSAEPATPPEATHTNQDRAETPRESKDGIPVQVTVLPEDEWDVNDAGRLQIRVSEQNSAYVLAGAQALLTSNQLADDKGTAILLAQGLLLDVARADLVVVAETKSESKPTGSPAMITFTFVTKEVIKGEGADEWTLDFLAEPGNCGVRPPKVKEEALFFLRVTKDGLSLANFHAIRGISDGKIAGFPGSAPETTDVKAAHLAGVKSIQP